MLRGSFSLGRVAGIDVRAHYTWALAFVFVALSTARAWFPSSAPGFDPTTYALMGASAALLLFASVLLHELSHSFVARARGQQVQGITLFVFGGFSKVEAQAPSDEFLIAIVGPLASFALAGVFWLIGQLLLTPRTPLGEVVAYLTAINLLIGTFNLLPGLPLDGGRVLRSVIWRATGSPTRATRIAGIVAHVFAAVFIGIGMSQLLAGQTFAGLWIILVGWFLGIVTGRTRRQERVDEDLRGMRVGDLMDARPAYADPDLTVEEFVVEHALRGGRLELVVVGAGRLAGIVTVAEARALPQERWSITPVARIMTRAPMPVLSPETDVSEVLDVLAAAPFTQIPVVRDGWVVGMFGRADISRFRWLRTNLDLQERHWEAASARPATAPVRRPAG
jgi:Zn-dependent protease